MTIDPKTLGAQANALVEKYERSVGPYNPPRAALHDAFLELLVRIANLEAEEADSRKTLSAAMNAGNDGYRELRELTEIAQAVVDEWEPSEKWVTAPMEKELAALAAYLEEKP